MCDLSSRPHGVVSVNLHRAIEVKHAGVIQRHFARIDPLRGDNDQCAVLRLRSRRSDCGRFAGDGFLDFIGFLGFALVRMMVCGCNTRP